MKRKNLPYALSIEYLTGDIDVVGDRSLAKVNALFQEFISSPDIVEGVVCIRRIVNREVVSVWRPPLPFSITPTAYAASAFAAMA
jgi:hypothetical protein